MITATSTAATLDLPSIDHSSDGTHAQEDLVKWVDDLPRDKLDDLGHLEGDEPLVRLLTTLKKWGMLLATPLRKPL